MDIFSTSENLLSRKRGNFFLDISSEEVFGETDSFFYRFYFNIFYLFESLVESNMIDVLYFESWTHIHLENDRSEFMVENDIASDKSDLSNFLHLYSKFQNFIPMWYLHTTHISNPWKRSKRVSILYDIGDFPRSDIDPESTRSCMKIGFSSGFFCGNTKHCNHRNHIKNDDTYIW